MANRNSRIIIAKNIKLDKNYKNVLTYTEEQMLQLVEQNKVNESLDYSFIKVGENVINTGFSYDECLQCNYVAFQNPHYSNKWFFAFIDEVEYNSNGSARIHYTVDEFSTWYSYWSPKTCFVIREHVNNDAVGLHTVPENLETGEYICNEHIKDSTMDSYASDLCFILASTSLPIAGEAKETPSGSGIYNGIYTGLAYYRYDETSPIDTMLEIFANSGKTDAINGVFMAPKWLAPLSGGILRDVAKSNSPATFNINISKQTTLNGYSPRNNKLKCFPYNYLLLSNNIGQNAILHYEKFSENNATFKVNGVLNPGCSINITPTNYNGASSNDNEAIQLGKFPICNFQNDMYTNWLTQNSINVLGHTITSDDLNIASAGLGATVGTITNIAAGNYAGAGMSIAGGFTGVSSAVMQQKQHNMISPTVNGQLNSADVNVASGNNTFHFYKMTIKSEYAKICDDYLSRMGYKVNTLKVPNQTGRLYWNYVQIGGEECIGYPNNQTYSVPANSMAVINDIYRGGVTLWHNHNNLGNYSLNNTIV